MRGIAAIAAIALIYFAGVRRALKGWENGNIVCAGNSLTVGYLLQAPQFESYPAQLFYSPDAQGLSIAVTNKGVNGITTQQMHAAIADVNILFNASVKSVCIAWEIGNDIWFNGTDGQAAYLNFFYYCQSLKSQGWYVVAVTVPPRDAVSAFGDPPAVYMQKVSAANELLLRDWKSYCDKIVDINSIPELATVNPVYYYPDKIHIRASGYSLFKDLLVKKLFHE